MLAKQRCLPSIVAIGQEEVQFQAQTLLCVICQKDTSKQKRSQFRLRARQLDSGAARLQKDAEIQGDQRIRIALRGEICLPKKSSTTAFVTSDLQSVLVKSSEISKQQDYKKMGDTDDFNDKIDDNVVAVGDIIGRKSLILLKPISWTKGKCSDARL